MAKTRIDTDSGGWIYRDPDDAAREANLVLFVHGYGGDADATWLRFPNLLLQADQGFYDDYEVASFGYGTAMLANRETLDSLSGQLRTFLRAHAAPRQDVFIIAHSLGGLLARRFLVDAHGRERYRELFGQVRQVHFIGVPHLGAAPGRGWLARIFRPVNRLAWDIRRDSPALAETLAAWRAIRAEAALRGEPLPELYNYVGGRDWVAPMAQVSDGPLEDTEVVETVAGDHLAIAKPVTASNEAYLLIKRSIQGWVSEHAAKASDRPGESATIAGAPAADDRPALTPATPPARRDQAALLSEVATLLEPLVATAEGRRALLSGALSGSAALRRVDLGGDGFTFSGNAVQALWDYGRTDDGRPALRRLMMAAAALAGEERRGRLDALAAELWPEG